MALLAIGLLLFWPTTATLIEQWEDTVRRTYTHGYLIAATTFWLLWRGRGSWAHVRIVPSAVAFAALLAASIAWLVAYHAGLRIVHQVLMPAIIFFAVAACYGLTIARRVSFAFGFFYFAVPLWDALVAPLQSASVFATRQLLRVAGIPAYFSGNTFTMPAGSLEIAGGCSGLHFFVVALAIALLYGEVNRDSWRIRARLAIFAALLAMATNWLRIFIIAVAGHLTDMQHPLVSDEHYSFGWLMFLGAMVVFFLVVRRWPIESSESAPGTTDDGEQGQSAVAWPAVALALGGLLVVPVWLFVDDNRASAADVTSVLPAAVPGWLVSSEAHDDWQPVFVGADVVHEQTFTHASNAVETFSAVYASQHHGKELLGYKNSVTGKSLNVKQQAGAADARWLEMAAIDGRGETWLLWYAYRIDEQWYRPGLSLQLGYGVRSLTAAPLSAVVALRTVCAGDDCSAARAVLGEFAAAAWPSSELRIHVTANDGQ